MKNIVNYIQSFFDELEIYEDMYGKKNHKEQLVKAIFDFIKERTESKAYQVYKSFFSAYWIGIQKERNPFLELTQIMHQFEKSAGQLCEKQRDHYVHTVFVFILGLVVYGQNRNYKCCFNGTISNNSMYQDYYSTKNEEFFYRWGIASLSHDIAYPLEIVAKQANKYLDIIWNYPDYADNTVNIQIEFSNFKKYLSLPILQPDVKFKEDYFYKYPHSFNSDSISLLSENISKSFSLSFDDVNQTLISFVDSMKAKGFIDHALYSSLIILRWYYYLIKSTNWNPAYFYFPIVDSASAILLHNYYRSLKQSPFNLGPMKPEHHPIAHLLILCDELQEWNRDAYGEKDNHVNLPIDFDVHVDDSEISLNYIYKETDLTSFDFTDKINNINSLIDYRNLFSKGVKLDATS